MKNIMMFCKTHIKLIAKAIWWLILLVCTVIYFLLSFDRIITKTITLDYIVIAVSIILVFMPFMSEIEVFGISLKKQIDSVKDELDKGMFNIQKQLLDIKISNNQISTLSQNISFNGTVPSKDEIEDAKKSTEYQVIDLEVSSELSYLFSVRYNLEQKIRKTASLFKIEDMVLSRLVQILVKYCIFDNSTGEVISKILNLCNRAIHGEIVSEEYVNYVKSVLPEIILMLDDNIKRQEERHQMFS